MTLKVLFLSAAISCVHSAQNQSLSKINGEDFSSTLKSLLTGYDKILRPSFGEKPVKVSFSLYITSLGRFNEVEGTYFLTMYMRSNWKDQRLQFNHPDQRPRALSSQIVEQLWVPDTFFFNEDSSRVHDVTFENKLIQLYPNGSIFYSVRLSIKAVCKMNLIRFPMDQQDCCLEFGSYGYNTDEIAFRWISTNKSENVFFSNSLHDGKFDLVNVDTVSRVESYGMAGHFTVMSVIFTFNRKMGYFLLYVYIPAAMLVTISWLSFWIDSGIAPARIALGITTALSLITIINGIQSSLPKVSYLKALDWYLAVCFFFVLASLIEFSAVHYLARTRKIRSEMKKLRAEQAKKADKTSFRVDIYGHVHRSDSRDHSSDQGKEGSTDYLHILKNILRIIKQHFPDFCPTDIDRLSRSIFPLVFVCFNTLYWAILV